MILVPTVTETMFEEIRDKVRLRVTETKHWLDAIEKPKTKLVKRKKKKSL